jgi:hypothetical protein
VFDAKKEPTPRKGLNPKRMPNATQFPPSSLNEKFEENQDAKDFDMESLEAEEEPMPNLHCDKNNDGEETK